MMVFGIVAALLWLVCSLIYVWAFFYEFFDLKEQQGTTQHMDGETTGHPPLPPSEDEDVVVQLQD
jgi:hypothetical protein